MKIEVDFVRISQTWDVNTGTQTNSAVFHYAGRDFEFVVTEDEAIRLMQAAQAPGMTPTPQVVVDPTPPMQEELQFGGDYAEEEEPMGYADFFNTKPGAQPTAVMQSQSSQDEERLAELRTRARRDVGKVDEDGFAQG